MGVARAKSRGGGHNENNVRSSTPERTPKIYTSVCVCAGDLEEDQIGGL